jgi:hypothetical protein
MAFFSGLKAAYDSLGNEITKTFDSSQGGQDSRSEDWESGEPPETSPDSTSPGVIEEVRMPLLQYSGKVGVCKLRWSLFLWS